MKTMWRKKLAQETLVYDRDQYLASDILTICDNLVVTPKLLAH